MSFASRFPTLLAVLALAGALAACGDDSDNSSEAASSGGSASSGTSNAQDAARVKLKQPRKAMANRRAARTRPRRSRLPLGSADR
jgi:hypothetical protein